MVWKVETDRGTRRFVTRNAREQAQHPLPGYIILTDATGNRYDIPNAASLDAESRRILEERL